MTLMEAVDECVLHWRGKWWQEKEGFVVCKANGWILIASLPPP